MSSEETKWAQTYMFDNGVVDVAEDDTEGGAHKMSVTTMSNEGNEQSPQGNPSALSTSTGASTLKSGTLQDTGNGSLDSASNKKMESSASTANNAESEKWRRRLVPKMSSPDDVDDAMLDLREAGTEMGEVFLFQNDGIEAADDGVAALVTKAPSCCRLRQCEAANDCVTVTAHDAAAGIVMAGDVVLEVNGMPVGDHYDGSTALRKAKGHIRILLQRGDKKVKCTVYKPTAATRLGVTLTDTDRPLEVLDEDDGPACDDESALKSPHVAPLQGSITLDAPTGKTPKTPNQARGGPQDTEVVQEAAPPADPAAEKVKQLRDQKSGLAAEIEALETEITVKATAREVEKMVWAVGADRHRREKALEASAAKQKKLQELRFTKLSVESDLEDAIEASARKEVEVLKGQLEEANAKIAQQEGELASQRAEVESLRWQTQQAQLAATARLQCTMAELDEVRAQVVSERLKVSTMAAQVGKNAGLAKVTAASGAPVASAETDSVLATTTLGNIGKSDDALPTSKSEDLKSTDKSAEEPDARAAAEATEPAK